VSLRDSLVTLASGTQHRSETARLHDVFDEVEAALQAGVRRKAILETLHANGFTMTLRSFESALARLRKRRIAAQQGALQATNVVMPAALQSAPHTTPPGSFATRAPVPVQSSASGLPAAPAAGRTSPAARRMPAVVAIPAPTTLPDDWLTCKPFPGLSAMLTPQQKVERRAARDRKYHPSIYDPPLEKSSA
jgi:hypothetical protein